MLLPREIVFLFAMAGISKVKGMTTSSKPTPSLPLTTTSTTTSPRVSSSSPTYSLPSTPSACINGSSSSKAIDCGGIFTSSSGTLRHPPNGGNYLNCENCIWIIETTYPSITFQSFDIEKGYDYLYVRDGDNISSPLLGIFTGYDHPHTLHASSNALYLQFTSDYIVPRSGFELQWKSSRCSSLEFACDSTRCIPIENRCNKIKDCDDNTDEEGCLFSGDECLENTRDFSTCAELVCRNKIWIPTGALNQNCHKCSLSNDPHFYTYENVAYDWHVPCNYSITQEGVSQNPSFALYGQFDLCNPGISGVACIGDFVYVESNSLIIKFGVSRSISNVYVNGAIHEVPADPLSGTILGMNDTEEYVLAWRAGSCLWILGSHGIMMKYCSWSITIWAHPGLKNTMYGFCGTITDSADGYGLEGRNYTQYGKPTEPWPNNLIDKEFALDWQTLDQMGNCSINNNKHVRQIQESACNANATELESYKTVCAEHIDTDLPSDQLGILIDDCAFDRCVLLEAIRNNPSGNFPEPEEWLNQAGKEAKREADINNSTVNPADRCEGSEGWRGKCFGTQGDLSGYTKCDSLITNATGCDDGQTCCVECSFLTDLCEHKWDDSVAWKSPCLRCDRKMGEIRLGSGCSCCKRCKRKHKCKKNNGRCISDKDPIHNREWCRAKSGVIEEGWCKGRGCYCCIWK